MNVNDRYIQRFRVMFTAKFKYLIADKKSSNYRAFQKHNNSYVKKLPSELFFVIVTIASNKSCNTENTTQLRNTQKGSKSTNHTSQTMTF